MSKLILLLFLGLLAYLIYKGFKRKSPGRESEPGPKEPERMVSCAHCGVHLPESEALEREGRRYCSEEHRRLGAP